MYVGSDSFINSVRVGRGAGSFASNTVIGSGALASNTSGLQNTAVGFGALASSSTANNNTAVGYNVLDACTGSDNTAVGSNALGANVAGTANSALGLAALSANLSGNQNTSIGYASLFSSTGSNNTAIGYGAGYGDGTSANTSGSNNTFVGFQSMGATATESNVVTLGNSSITTLRCQTNTITLISDARDKTDIEPLAFGLDFINALNPVSFTWNMRQPEPKDGEPVEVFGKVGIPEIGFIAQELQAAQQATGVTIPGLVSTSNPDRLEAAPSTILPVLVKAIQQLSAQVTALQAQVAALEG
jgi:hypothetical protein